MIETKSLKFSYDGKFVFEFPNIKLKKGENLLILGSSGIGKSTLLHNLAGILTPQSGSIKIFGNDISKFSEIEIDKFRGENIGIIFQRPHFVNSLTVKENLQLAQFLGKNLEGDIKETLRSLKILDKIDKKPNDLSQGEKQRVSIAIAIINSPKLILADEPTSSLDDSNCSNVINILKEQASKKNAQLIVITHDSRLKKHFKTSLKL
ncbi:MAG: ATP-binding cassette domain-containing protein [Bacteroidota bacterium]|nr:ATP-binding cassette domain-containing protein [Bacteroidota bacterium]MEC8367360.1 ATP-binding cassette domain-containing protein [Bacteroidota bacterium]MEC8602476.1 ATP-binding cassette domain-containing protein [Bacteroidota bacterium]